MYHAYITKGQCDAGKCFAPNGHWVPGRPRVKGVMHEAHATNGPGTGVPILFLCWRHAGKAYNIVRAREAAARAGK
jgi:hypothetical protein